MFPTSEEFQKDVVSKQTVMKWKEVPLNIIFQVTEVKRSEGKFGPIVILTLESEQGEIFKCWSNQRLGEELADFQWLDDECYVKSLGLVPSKRNPGQQYYSYELCWKKLYTFN